MLSIIQIKVPFLECSYVLYVSCFYYPHPLYAKSSTFVHLNKAGDKDGWEVNLYQRGGANKQTISDK